MEDGVDICALSIGSPPEEEICEVPPSHLQRKVKRGGPFKIKSIPVAEQ